MYRNVSKWSYAILLNQNITEHLIDLRRHWYPGAHLEIAFIFGLRNVF